jgi:hypothetical protein
MKRLGNGSKDFTKRLKTFYRFLTIGSSLAATSITLRMLIRSNGTIKFCLICDVRKNKKPQ